MAFGEILCRKLVLRNMIPDISTTAIERTAEAQGLFHRSADGETVDLTALSGLELCVLGGPKHTLSDTTVTQAWSVLGRRRRNKAKDLITEGLVERGLLADNRGTPSGSADGDYSLAPNLAIALAARCRPTFIVVTEIANRKSRTPRFYALGDQEELVRGIVVEEPAVAPPEAGELPHLKKLGPLGWLYRYTLISQTRAAELLAQWAISPVPPPAQSDLWCPRTTSLYRRSEKPSSMGLRIITEGDGETAKLFQPEGDNEARVAAELDVTGLREQMAGLLAQGVA